MEGSWETSKRRREEAARLLSLWFWELGKIFEIGKVVKDYKEVRVSSVYARG